MKVLPYCLLFVKFTKLLIIYEWTLKISTGHIAQMRAENQNRTAICRPRTLLHPKRWISARALAMLEIIAAWTKKRWIFKKRSHYVGHSNASLQYSWNFMWWNIYASLACRLLLGARQTRLLSGILSVPLSSLRGVIKPADFQNWEAP